MQNVPFHLQLVRGAIGKQFVIKHYGKRVIMTKFPDMTKIKPSEKQVECRQLFALAVAYAKHINDNAELKQQYQARIKKGRDVYRSAIQEYLDTYKMQQQDKATGKNSLKLVKPGQKNTIAPLVVIESLGDMFFIPAVHYNDTG